MFRSILRDPEHILITHITLFQRGKHWKLLSLPLRHNSALHLDLLDLDWDLRLFLLVCPIKVIVAEQFLSLVA